MSIINCEKCSKAVDTDYNVEEIVYQNDTAVCSDCVEPQGYSYRVKHPVLYKDNNRQYLIGFIDAINKEEAIEKLCDKYYVEDDEVEVSHCGTWAELYNQLIKE